MNEQIVKTDIPSEWMLISQGVSISDDMYYSPSHSLHIENLYGNYMGEDNGAAFADLNLTDLNLTIPYEINFWWKAGQTSIKNYFNNFTIFEADKDISLWIHNDFDGNNNDFGL